eukprot:CFRG1020T1
MEPESPKPKLYTREHYERKDTRDDSDRARDDRERRHESKSASRRGKDEAAERRRDRDRENRPREKHGDHDERRKNVDDERAHVSRRDKNHDTQEGKERSGSHERSRYKRRRDRSMSESESESGISESESESETSSESESEDERRRRKRRKKDKKAKKSKKLKKEDSKQKKRKDKKLKRKSKKGKKDIKNKSGNTADRSYGKYGIIRSSDMWSKQPELLLYLQEIKNLDPDIISRTDLRTHFEDYMESYNTATLPHKKYYDIEKWTNAKIIKGEAGKEGEIAAMLHSDPFAFNDEELLRQEKAKRKAEAKLDIDRKELMKMAQVMRERREEDYKKTLGLRTDENRGVRYQ